MPQMGESIAEGTVSRWLKKVGDAVKRDEPIFEISTDKVDAEIPSPSAGVLAEILIGEGQTVAVQTIVARIETDASVGVAAPAAAPAPAASASVGKGAPEQARASAASTPPGAAAGSGGAVTTRPAGGSAGDGPRATGDGNTFEERIRTKSSPLVRRMAAEQGIDIAALQGSGIAGRVTKKDL